MKGAIKMLCYIPLVREVMFFSRVFVEIKIEPLKIGYNMEFEWKINGQFGFAVAAILQ